MSATTTKPLPLYASIKKYLADRIAAGDWQNGARLPSEHELMALFGASRMTVHRALREMSANGVLHRVQGRGTFIAAEKPHAALLEITDIANDIAARGHTHSARIIALKPCRADIPTGMALHLSLSAWVFYSEIVHLEDDVPVQLEQRFINPVFAPSYLKQDFLAQTTNSYLSAIAPPQELEHIVHAIKPEPVVAARLLIPRGAPCLRLVRRTWVQKVCVTRSILTHPGTRYSLGGRKAAT